MSRQLPGTHYQTTSCDMVICSGLVNVLVVSDRLKPMWHGTVDMPCIDFVAITAAYNWEPYLALMLGTAAKGDLAVRDTSVGLGPFYRSPVRPSIAGLRALKRSTLTGCSATNQA